jgi:hypothetical protein
MWRWVLLYTPTRAEFSQELIASIFMLQKWNWKAFRTNLLLLKLTVKQITYFCGDLSVSCYEISCGTKFGGVYFEVKSNKRVN